MAVDLFHSRRGNFFRCQYWLRNPQDKNSPENYTYENKASGVFYAKYANDMSQQKNQINNVVMIDAKRVTLVTTDSVKDIETGTIVKFRDTTWIVDSISMSIHLKEAQYGKIEGESFINLRR